MDVIIVIGIKYAWPEWPVKLLTGQVTATVTVIVTEGKRTRVQYVFDLLKHDMNTSVSYHSTVSNKS